MRKKNKKYKKASTPSTRQVLNRYFKSVRQAPKLGDNVRINIKDFSNPVISLFTT